MISIRFRYQFLYQIFFDGRMRYNWKYIEKRYIPEKNGYGIVVIDNIRKGFRIPLGGILITICTETYCTNAAIHDAFRRLRASETLYHRRIELIND